MEPFRIKFALINTHWAAEEFVYPQPLSEMLFILLQDTPYHKHTRRPRPSSCIQFGDIFERYHIEMQRNNIILQFNEYGN